MKSLRVLLPPENLQSECLGVLIAIEVTRRYKKLRGVNVNETQYQELCDFIESLEGTSAKEWKEMSAQAWDAVWGQ